MNKWILVGIIVFLTMVGIYVGYTLLKPPPTHEYEGYSLTGVVIPADEIFGNRPEYVFVSYYWYKTPDLYMNPLIKKSPITWLDEDRGKFSVYFQAPSSLKRVIITTDFGTCDFEDIYLDDIPESIQLFFGNKSCATDFDVIGDYDDILDKTRSLLSTISGELDNTPYNITEKNSVKSDTGKAWEEERSINQRTARGSFLLHSHYAYWYAWRAKEKMWLLKLGNCLEDVDEVLEDHKGSRCYTVDYNFYELYNSANHTYNMYAGELFSEETPNSEDIQVTKNQIVYIHRKVDDLSTAYYQCDESGGMLNETFEFQKSYCERTSWFLHSLYIALIPLFIFIGVIIGKRW